jgi:hypothetical protein
VASDRQADAEAELLLEVDGMLIEWGRRSIRRAAEQRYERD